MVWSRLLNIGTMKVALNEYRAAFLLDKKEL